MKRKTICIATLLVPSVVCTTASDCCAGELLREIQTEQCKLPYVTQNQVMQNVFKNYNNLNVEVKNTLDILWRNDAGNLLLRRLHNVIKDDNQRITILWDTCDERNDSNYFRYFDSTILLDQNKFGWDVCYCNGVIDILPECLDMVIFHELCHALHDFEGVTVYKQRKFIPAFYQLSENEEKCHVACDAWTDDEEVRTITGWSVDDDGTLKFECLNTNSYIILEELRKGTPPEKIQQRVYHCDYPTLTTKYKVAKKLPLDDLVIPFDKYVDEPETTCYTEEWMDLR